MAEIVKIQIRRGTAALWASENPVLGSGEPAYETDTNRKKIGNGTDNYNDLPYWDEDTITIQAARNRNTTNTYLMSEGVFMNKVPVYFDEDLFLTGISASTDGNESWVAEVHDDGALIPGATLTLSSESEKQDNTLNIPISAGSKLMFYVNGSKIKRPRILITLRK